MLFCSYIIFFSSKFVLRRQLIKKLSKVVGFAVFGNNFIENFIAHAIIDLKWPNHKNLFDS